MGEAFSSFIEFINHVR